MPLIFCHCFIMPFLGEENSSPLIRSKAEHLFNGGLYIDNILPNSRNCLELLTTSQHKFVMFSFKKDQKISDISLSLID